MNKYNIIYYWLYNTFNINGLNNLEKYEIIILKLRYKIYE